LNATDFKFKFKCCWILSLFTKSELNWIPTFILIKSEYVIL